jgi:prephenate dehydratase
MSFTILPGDMGERAVRVAFLGPAGTFTEEALLTQADLGGADLVAEASMTEVLAAVERGEADFGFVPIENSIEGTVRETLDALIFDRDLLIQREVVLGISLSLLGPAGLALADVRRVVSYPVATAQCREWLQRELPGAMEVAATSTAEAARVVGEERPSGTAAVGTALAAKLYGLEVLAADIEDHPENATRFVLVARPEAGIPEMTGHDKTTLVCFQHRDRPGSLHAILGQFSARNLNLTNLQSRPTKQRLGHYCFLIELEGHVDDEVVADCLRDLHASLAELKYLGSYPAAGEHGPAIRRDAEKAWRKADEWIRGLQGNIRREGDG